MGLFSKEKVICERCGKEFEAGFFDADTLCKDCKAEWEAVAAELDGYAEYAIQVKGEYPSVEQLREMEAQRKEIFEKYARPQLITRRELEDVNKYYRNIPENKIRDIAARIKSSQFMHATGMDIAPDFIVLRKYTGVTVEAKDIFAVTYLRQDVIETKMDNLLLAMFTNNPFVPIIVAHYGFPLKFGEYLESKAGRQQLFEAYRNYCPNLTYPIMKFSDFKAQIQGEKMIRGNINQELMERLLFQAVGQKKIFDVADYSCALPELEDLYEKYGYISKVTVINLLDLNEPGHSRFWSKYLY